MPIETTNKISVTKYPFGIEKTEKNETTVTTGKELEEKRKNQGERNERESLAERLQRQRAEKQKETIRYDIRCK